MGLLQLHVRTVTVLAFMFYLVMTYWHPNTQVDGSAFIAWTVVTPAKTPVKSVAPTSANKTRRKNTVAATPLEPILAYPCLTHRR